MAAKLGSTDVSFRLGATTPSKVYLGAVEVWANAKTLYFTGAVDVDNDWGELGNWFNDAEGTVPASSLPTAADSVVASASIGFYAGDPITIANFTMLDPLETSPQLAAHIAVTGVAEFYGTADNVGSITGNVNFYDSAQNLNTVIGYAAFYGSSIQLSQVIGEAAFFDSSQLVNGTVTGNATFNDNSSFSSGTVTGTVTCNTTGSCSPTE